MSKKNGTTAEYQNLNYEKKPIKKKKHGIRNFFIFWLIVVLAYSAIYTEVGNKALIRASSLIGVDIPIEEIQEKGIDCKETVVQWAEDSGVIEWARENETLSPLFSKFESISEASDKTVRESTSETEIAVNTAQKSTSETEISENDSVAVEFPGLGSYLGSFENNERSGNGTFEWENGDIYVGEWNADHISGKGVYTWSDGSVYQGEFENDKASGEGELLYATGEKYSGGFLDGEIEGYGIFEYPSIGVYEGEFKNSKRNGEGKFTWTDGTYLEGDWENDAFTGNGALISGNKELNVTISPENMLQITSDDGAFSVTESESKIQAEITFDDGSSYKGEIKDNKLNGSGIYTDSNGNIKNGVFKNNLLVSGTFDVSVPEGTGSFTIEDSKIVSANIKYANGDEYTGEYSDISLNGTGKMVYSCGDVYEGSFSDGQKSGDGKYTWKNGAIYTGAWANDKMQGSGTYFYPSTEKGYKLVGNFWNGKPNGSCTYYLTNTQSYKTTWENGTCVAITR